VPLARPLKVCFHDNVTLSSILLQAREAEEARKAEENRFIENANREAGKKAKREAEAKAKEAAEAKAEAEKERLAAEAIEVNLITSSVSCVNSSPFCFVLCVIPIY